jgi:hypothetical protein
MTGKGPLMLRVLRWFRQGRFRQRDRSTAIPSPPSEEASTLPSPSLGQIARTARTEPPQPPFTTPRERIPSTPLRDSIPSIPPREEFRRPRCQNRFHRFHRRDRERLSRPGTSTGRNDRVGRTARPASHAGHTQLSSPLMACRRTHRVSGCGPRTCLLASNTSPHVAEPGCRAIRFRRQEHHLTQGRF